MNCVPSSSQPWPHASPVRRHRSFGSHGQSLARLIFGLAGTVWAAGAAGAGPTVIPSLASGPGAQLRWTAWPGAQGYRVEYRASLSGGAWLPCPWQDQWPQAGTNWLDPRTLAGERFYRVLVLTNARGGVVSFTGPTAYTVANLNFFFSYAGITNRAQYEVDVFIVRYDTVTADGGATRASGVVMLPRNVGRPLPLLSYHHGTVLLTNDVASSGLLSGEYGVGLVAASSGYACSLPDYLGMGSGSGLHPYVHARSEATAAIDLLRAARTICGPRGVALSGQVFLIGYSQGGQATMATHREIELGHTNEFTLTASAPMAGPYDMSGTMAEVLTSDQAYANPCYMPYTLFAYNSVYRLYDSVTQALVAPYTTNLPPLFDGLHDDATINAVMPPVPNQILRPDFLLAFRTDPNHPFRQALRRNDLYDWRPVAPLRLYHCSGDRTVPYTNSVIARNRFHTNGATHVLLFDPAPGADHGGGAEPCFQAAKQWFDTLKQ